MSLSVGPPRVLYCTDTYPPQVNGVSVVTALSVAGLRERGWECAVVAPQYPAGVFNAFDAKRERLDEDVTSVIPSIPFPGYREIRLAAPMYGRVLDQIRRFQPDLVHCETEFVIGRLGQIAANRLGIPLVTSYHTDFSRYTVAYGAPWLRGVVSAYIGRFHRRALRTYTPSEPAMGDLHAFGVPDVEVWGRGVDTDVFHPRWRSDALRSSLEVGGKFVFVHVGRLAAEKNVEVILEAFALARRLLPANAICLYIAGSGPHELRLRRQAPEGVTFLGHMDRARRLPALYASADAFLFASLTETLGLVVLEAMSSGLPVIAAPAGGVADHLRHERNGLAYPSNDVAAMAHAMVRVVMDGALTDKLRIGARATAEARSWDREFDRLNESYREVCHAASTVAEASPSREARRALAKVRSA